MVFFWAFYAAATITILPLWEGRGSIREFLRWGTGKGISAGKARRKNVEVVDAVSVRKEGQMGVSEERKPGP